MEAAKLLFVRHTTRPTSWTDFLPRNFVARTKKFMHVVTISFCLVNGFLVTYTSGCNTDSSTRVLEYFQFHELI